MHLESLLVIGVIFDPKLKIICVVHRLGPCVLIRFSVRLLDLEAVGREEATSGENKQLVVIPQRERK